METSHLRILLTGASSGIGWHLTKLLAQDGTNRILAIARHTEAIPSKTGVIFPFQADFSLPKEIDRCFLYAKEQWGGVDVCIANAGFAYRECLQESGLSGNDYWNHIHKILATNTIGQIYTLQAFTDLKTNPNPEFRKRLFVSTISAVAMVPLPYYALYCSTKSALDGFLKTYDYEKPAWLRLMRVYPVATKTDFFCKAAREEYPPLPFLRQKPESVAQAVFKGIRKGRCKVYPSKLFAMAYPFMRALPFLSRLYSRHERIKMQRHFKQTDKMSRRM